MNLCGRRSDQVSILISLEDPSAVKAHEIAPALVIVPCGRAIQLTCLSPTGYIRRNLRKAIERPKRRARGTSRKWLTLRGEIGPEPQWFRENVEGDLDTCRRLVTGATVEAVHHAFEKFAINLGTRLPGIKRCAKTLNLFRAPGTVRPPPLASTCSASTTTSSGLRAPALDPIPCWRVERLGDKPGEMCNLPCAAAFHRTGEESKCTGRDRRGFFPSGSVANPHVPHVAPKGTVDTHPGRVLPRWALRNARRRSGTLQHVLQSGSE